MARTRGNSSLRLLIAAVACTALVAAGCSDDDSGGGGGGGSASGDRVEIRWFVGLGTGSQAEQIARQEALVQRFNDSQDDIVLVAEFVDNNVAKDTLTTQIAGGNPPDIIGPVGREGANAFQGQYLDLEPLVEAHGFDLSAYDEGQIEVWREDDGSLTSLPFASYPAMIYINTELFDEAGLAYPPQEYGEPYADGDPWDMDKLTELATLLTVDAAGNDATDEAFDASSTEQWGFVHQWTAAPRSQGTFFGAGSIEGADGTAEVPEHWLAEWRWYHDLIHNVGAAPNQQYLDSEILGGNAFNSGRVAMAHTHLWYTCCLLDADENARTWFDLAVVPSYEGEVTSKLHADTFRILSSTDNPDEAFQVLMWMLDEAALDLLTIYGAMPARLDLQDSYFERLDEQFTQGVNWQVAIDGLAFPDIPSHELYMPNFLESDAAIKEYETRIQSEPDLDIDAMADELVGRLNALWANAG
ncbi:MAG: ABC transporter substrate-binding protein [Acidimicrobiales bacterium]